MHRAKFLAFNTMRQPIERRRAVRAAPIKDATVVSVADALPPTGRSGCASLAEPREVRAASIVWLADAYV